MLYEVITADSCPSLNQHRQIAKGIGHVRQFFNTIKVLVAVFETVGFGNPYLVIIGEIKRRFFVLDYQFSRNNFV